MTMRTLFLTGATGLLGRDVLDRLLAADATTRVIALVRNVNRGAFQSERVTPVAGDLRVDGLGLNARSRRRIRRSVTGIIHVAADTCFSRPLTEARAVNTEGTRRVLELASECASPVRVVHVSTAFVAGKRTGVIGESDGDHTAGWTNAYEQSKYEAEALVREHAADWAIFRPSTIVCDDVDGRVSRMNAVHRALKLYRDGLAAMMPGVRESTVDVVTTSYVGRAIAELGLRDDLSRKTVHLCAGAGALPLRELLDTSWERWAIDPAWRRRAIPRPALADLRTYALFERSIEEAGDASLRRIMRSLSHFVPQLALPKQFDTTTSDTLLGAPAPVVRDFWIPMLDSLAATNWGTAKRAA